MNSRSRGAVVAVPTAVIAVVGTGLAAAVNYATGERAVWWQWVIVAVLTVAYFLGSLWLHRRQSVVAESPRTNPGSVTASGTRSVAIGGNANGTISTGDRQGPPQP